MRSANPALNDKVFNSVSIAGQDDLMTLEGTVNKTFISVAITAAAAYWSWSYVGLAVSPVLLFGAVIATLGIAFALYFRKQWAPVLTPVYALIEGFLLGVISLMYAVSTADDPTAVVSGNAPPNTTIVFNAISLTFGTLFALLMAYRSGMIKATENFKLGVAAATGGIFVVYMISFVMSMFGMQMPYLHDSGPIGIGISLFVIVIAALNLVLDFDFIENAVESGQAPKYMEWYGAFGLLVTLVWLYLEFLRLLAKLQSRD